MENLKLLDVKIEKIVFNNNIVIPKNTGTVDIQIGSSICTNVNYDEENGLCKCMTSVDITPQNIQVDFRMFICVAGIFEYEKGANRSDIHIAACKKLFPNVQSSITSVMTLVGIPNFILEEPDVKVEDVKYETDNNK